MNDIPGPALTRRDLQRALVRLGLHEARAQDVVGWLLDEIAVELARSGKVVISGFGTFRVVARRARRAHNPKTGAAVSVPAKRVVTFQVSRELKKTFNGSGGA